MKKFFLSVVILLFFLAKPGTGYSNQACELYLSGTSKTDSIRQSMTLYNGRIWQNLWYMIDGDQFLFSKDFIPGALTMRGKSFRNVRLKFDIYRDEVLIPIPNGGILQVNKEMVDSFSFNFQNKTYRFLNSSYSESGVMTGYVNVLYSGKTSLYLKYFKKTEPSKGTVESDRFYQGQRILIQKDGIVNQVKSKKDLLLIMNDRGEQVKSYIKKNRLTVAIRDPESFIPVLRYYDSIK
jgi:hypothetical protein